LHSKRQSANKKINDVAQEKAQEFSHEQHLPLFPLNDQQFRICKQNSSEAVDHCSL